MIALADYELISIRPGILIARVENEELKVRIFPIPIHLTSPVSEGSPHRFGLTFEGQTRGSETPSV